MLLPWFNILQLDLLMFTKSVQNKQNRSIYIERNWSRAISPASSQLVFTALRSLMKVRHQVILGHPFSAFPHVSLPCHCCPWDAPFILQLKFQATLSLNQSNAPFYKGLIFCVCRCFSMYLFVTQSLQENQSYPLRETTRIGSRASNPTL